MRIEEYYARAGSLFTDKDAALVGPELTKLAQDGKSTAFEVVVAASSRRSTLHTFFEWDNEIAGHRYREYQARTMMRAIEVRITTSTGEEKRIRAFHNVHVQTKKNMQEQYYTVEQIAKNPVAAGQVIDEAWQRLQYWQSTYERYCEVWPEFASEFQEVLTAIANGNAEAK